MSVRNRAARCAPCVLLLFWQLIIAEVSCSVWPIVHLHTASIDTRTHVQRHQIQRRELLERKAVATSDDRWGVLRGADQFLISMQGPLQQDTLQNVKQTLESHGGWLSSYIPDSTVLGIGPSTCAEAVRHVPGVLWVGDYEPGYKLTGDWEPLLEKAATGDLHSMLQQHAEQAPMANESFRGTLAPDLVEGGRYRAVIHAHFPMVRNATTARLSGNGAVPSFAPAEAAATDWAAAADRRFGAAVALRPEGRTVLAVSAEPHVLQEVLEWLAEQPAVHWLAPRAALRLHNWQGTAIVQSGNAAPDAPLALAADRGTHPVWAAGLTGAGQVIGAGDSGVDRSNCYFNDPNVDWKAGLTTDPSSGVVTFSSEAHRKIRLYRQQADDIDNNGHGTHTVGSLLGSPFDISDIKHLDYRGMAPDAKVAFIDLASSTSGGIYTPQDLSEQYYPFTYRVGARVHSDSWGSGAAAQDYDFMASEVDLFTWENQDFTAVFAAGNEGFTGSRGGLTTVTSPATSKNCICAGATNTAYQRSASTSSSQYTVHKMSISQTLDSGSQVVDNYRVMQASFGNSIQSLYGQQFALSVAHPADGCAALDNQADVAGTVVLVLRGTCFFTVKALNAQAAGAKAILVYDDQINDYFVPASDGTLSGITIPSGAIPRRTGQLLVSSCLAGGKLTVSFSEAPPLANSYDSLADFSSKGPTKDGRVKPDLLAPGTLQSAYTDGSNTCSLRYMEGTSMATPLIAASAALVRQYFLTGFYPSGAPVPANQFAPSGALVKAVLLGGAAGMDGFESDTELPLAPPPSFRQGYGRLHLGRSLPLQGSGPGWNLQIVDMANLSTGQAHQYCVRGLGGPLSVTLVWHDYPAAVSAKKALVNDLDLTIRAAGLNGIPLLGNGGGIGSGDTFAPDRTNNVEQVSVSYLPPGEVAIEVKAFQTFSTHGPQKYALAVLGKFSGILASPGNPANGGSVQPGKCHVVATTITGGPEGLTNQRSVVFTFTAATGNPSGVKFECALMGADANSGNASMEYKACTSPVTYADLADGAYNFSVRAQGEDSADSRSFIKDTIPPKLGFNATVSQSGNASPMASLSWTAQDMSPVTYQCHLSAATANSGDLQPPVHALLPTGPLPGPVFPLGSWADCEPPLQLYWLLPGAWRFEVQGKDAAGNAAAQNLLAEWTVDMDSGEEYARIAAGPFGPTANTTAQFSLLALQGGTAQPPTALPGAAFECKLTGLTDQSSWKGSTVWSPCGDSVTYTNLQDGDYTFSARIAGQADGPQATLAASNFTVDTAAPVLKIVSAPPTVGTSSTTMVQFEANKPGTSFSCQLMNQGNATAGDAHPVPCSSPAERTNLPDGRYSFLVAAADRLGNRAAPIQAYFLIDTTPPVISDVAFPFATRNSSVIVNFSVTDSGSGVNRTECRMRPQKLLYSTDSTALKGPQYYWTTCSSPALFRDLAQGKWGLSLRAQDNAGLLYQTREADLYVTRTPPNATVVGGPSATSALPSQVTFSFASQVGGGAAGAPVAYSLCLMQPEDNSQVTALQQAGGQPWGTGNVNIQLKSVTGMAAISWSNCSSPAEFKGLRSGNYTFQVKSVDAAGNVGTASRPYAFTVDDTLPIPGASAAAGWFTGWHRTAVIAGAAGAVALLVLATVACACARRRRLHRLRSEGPIGAAIYPQHDPALEAALQASLAEQRRQPHPSGTDARMRAAMVESLEEERMRRALERSLLEQGSPQRRERGALPPPREGSDPELRRALQQSLEEEQLRRVLADSERSACPPTAPLWNQ
ncbi:probable c5a peptidase at N-terminal half [Coccomyxa sp. Obi]|nr:probable c5a peptidase at N-terminal half [Coccomyxa sp. Obi]